MLAMLLVALTAFAGDTIPDYELRSPNHLEIKWMRDSGEYAALTRQTFRAGLAAIEREHPKKGAWTVVFDVDETLLDNSPYFLEVVAYGGAFSWAAWDAWCERRTAQAIPGAAELIAGIRAAGGRVSFITNRHERTLEATRENLRAQGLWADTDALCLLTDDDARTKRVRRAELQAGSGSCGWSGQPTPVVAYFGDALSDFPEDDEAGPRADQFGRRYFVLPNPSYGSWEHAVTRP